jgi:glycosyltransferase involved in cell wall biosynthesis
MNILIANTQEFNPHIGGVERVSSFLASEFQRLGHNIFFLACIKSPYSKEYQPVVLQTLLKDNIEFNSSKNIREFCSLLIEYKIDIIVNQAGNIKKFSSLCFEAAKVYKHAKVISVIHIDPIYKFKSLFDFSPSILFSHKKYKILAHLLFLPYWLLKTYYSESNLYNYIYNKSDKVVLLSDSFKKNFKTITRLTSYTKLTAISNPFPFRMPLIPEENRKENIILYVGRIDYWHKRVDKILDIWSKLALEFPSWTLDIVGNGPIKEELLEIVKINKIERVNFFDFSDPFEFYKRSKIFCMTSNYEGLPMVLIEASYFGCIPIAFKSFPSLPDIIENGVNGYMIKRNNISDYKQILRLLMKDELLQKKIEGATINIPNKFQSKIIVKQWISLFEELLEKRSFLSKSIKNL